MEIRSQWSLVDFERLITGKALVNPHSMPKQMFILGEKLYFVCSRIPDKMPLLKRERRKKNQHTKTLNGLFDGNFVQANEKYIVVLPYRIGKV